MIIMAKWKGITAEELIVLRQIQRLNYQLRAIHKEFGSSGRLYQHYENFLTQTRKNTLGEAGLLRETKEGSVLQLKADKRSVQEIMRYTQYQKQLNRAGKFSTLGQYKKRMIQAYQARTGKSLEGAKRKDIQAAYKEEKQFEQDVYETVNDVLYRYYELEKKEAGEGKEFASHDELRRLSKGSHTDPEDLKRMVEIVNQELEAENHEIKDQYDDYLAGL